MRIEIGLRTLKGKILFSVLFCFIAIGIPSLFLLYSYMNNIVYEQVNAINGELISKETENIDMILSELISSIAWISQNSTVKEAMELSSAAEQSAKLKILNAHDQISTYMSATVIWKYLNKLVVFNNDGIFFEYASSRNGSLQDAELIQARPEFKNLEFNQGTVVRIFHTTTINEPSDIAVIAYGQVQGSEGWIYAEMNDSFFDDLLKNSPIENTFVVSSGWSLPYEIPQELFSSSYLMNEIPLSVPDISVFYFVEKTQIHLDSLYGLTIFLIIMVAAIVMVITLGYLMTRIINRPTEHLVKYIKNLTEKSNYGVVDKSIEEGNDEIAEIGHTINEMSLSINDLLEKNEKLFEEKKKTEFNMLQMQVNPHFLYNTLESINYLASIQKAKGIASMARGLSNLLRNMAKGTDRHIPLSEELSLLHDYDQIQQVRYMGMYEIQDNIPEDLKNYKVLKFILQPLVENAIFHGIEPTGRDGTIVLNGYKDERYLYITVTDDGVGIPEDKINDIYKESSHTKSHMTGVGIKNINERLKLSYGEDCGLFFTSKRGEYTKATVKLLLEI